MAALWMIGIDDEPKRSGVVDVVEIFGKDIGPDRTSLAMGIGAFGDPDLVDHEGLAELDIDVTELHEYAVCWTEVAWFVDDVEVHRVDQSPSYPMQIMLGVYSFVDPTDRPDESDVFEPMFTLDRFRSYDRRRG